MAGSSASVPTGFSTLKRLSEPPNCVGLELDADFDLLGGDRILDFARVR